MASNSSGTLCNPTPIDETKPKPTDHGPTDDAFTRALQSNKEWASQMQRDKSELMANLSQSQKPSILWIGCADSRVPETTLLGLQPGEVFVHRNIANIVTPNDLSSAAAIAFAVGNLKVQHVVLCGHASCGGVAGALGNASLGGVLDTWLAPLRQVRSKCAADLAKLDSTDRIARLVQENVLQGVRVLKENPIVIQAVQDRGLKVHGVVYDLASGHLNVLDTQDPPEAETSRLNAFGLK